MALLGLLSNLLKALAAYWQLKSKRYEHDLREMSRARIEALEDEYTKLRNTTDPDSARYADRVFKRILTEKEYFKSLPDSNPSARSGNAGSND